MLTSKGYKEAFKDYYVNLVNTYIALKKRVRVFSGTLLNSERENEGSFVMGKS